MTNEERIEIIRAILDGKNVQWSDGKKWYPNPYSSLWETVNRVSHEMQSGTIWRIKPAEEVRYLHVWLEFGSICAATAKEPQRTPSAKVHRILINPDDLSARLEVL